MGAFGLSSGGLPMAVRRGGTAKVRIRARRLSVRATRALTS